MRPHLQQLNWTLGSSVCACLGGGAPVRRGIQTRLRVQSSLMAASASQIHRAQRELQSLLAEGLISHRQLAPIEQKIVPLVLDALGDPDHPLTGRMMELSTMVAEASRPTGDSPHIPKPHLVGWYFTPHPGSSGKSHRYFWQLQLLLQIVARSPRGNVLTERFSCSEAEFAGALEISIAASSRLWSPPQYGRYLSTALLALEYPAAPVELQDRELVQAAKRVKLGSLEAQMAKLLLEHAGKPVNHALMREHGINNPAEIKRQLIDKCRAAEIDFRVVGSPGTYTYYPG